MHSFSHQHCLVEPLLQHYVWLLHGCVCLGGRLADEAGSLVCSEQACALCCPACLAAVALPHHRSLPLCPSSPMHSLSVRRVAVAAAATCVRAAVVARPAVAVAPLAAARALHSTPAIRAAAVNPGKIHPTEDPALTKIDVRMTGEGQLQAAGWRALTSAVCRLASRALVDSSISLASLPFAVIFAVFDVLHRLVFSSERGVDSVSEGEAGQGDAQIRCHRPSTAADRQKHAAPALASALQAQCACWPVCNRSEEAWSAQSTREQAKASSLTVASTSPLLSLLSVRCRITCWRSTGPLRRDGVRPKLFPTDR